MRASQLSTASTRLLSVTFSGSFTEDQVVIAPGNWRDHYLILMLFSHFPREFLMLINYAMSEGKNSPTPGGHADHPYKGKSMDGKTGCMSSDDGKDSAAHGVNHDGPGW